MTQFRTKTCAVCFLSAWCLLVSGRFLDPGLQNRLLTCSSCQLGHSPGYFFADIWAITCFFAFLHCFCRLQESVDFELSHGDLNLDNDPGWDRRKCYQAQSLTVINLKLEQNFVEKETRAGVQLPYFICTAFAAVDFEPLHGFLTLPVVS